MGKKLALGILSIFMWGLGVILLYSLAMYLESQQNVVTLALAVVTAVVGALWFVVGGYYLGKFNYGLFNK